MRFGGQYGDVNAIGDASIFQTNGYRDHSWARRDQMNAKLKATPSDDDDLHGRRQLACTSPTRRTRSD